MENSAKYIPYVDGCRGIAIAIVVLSHAGLGHIIPGKFGVTFFFFISGFLITKLLLLEIRKEGHIGFRDFYLRRLFRLYPALLVMILVSSGAAYLVQCSLPAKDIYAALFYFTNYYIGWFRPPVADCARMLDIIWSLSVEEHFYFFFPLLIHLIFRNHRYNQQPLLSRILLALCFAGIVVRILTWFAFDGDISLLSGRIYFSSHTRIDSIIWGCLAAVMLYQVQSGAYTKAVQNKAVLFVGALALFLSVAIRNEFFRQTFLYSFQGFGLFILVPAIGFMGQNIIKRTLESKWLIFIGKISYSLYLFHWIALKISNRFTEEYSLTWQCLFWTLALVLSLGSYYLVEKPFVQLRRRFGSTAGA